MRVDFETACGSQVFCSEKCILQRKLYFSLRKCKFRIEHANFAANMHCALHAIMLIRLARAASPALSQATARSRRRIAGRRPSRRADGGSRRGECPPPKAMLRLHQRLLKVHAAFSTFFDHDYYQFGELVLKFERRRPISENDSNPLSGSRSRVLDVQAGHDEAKDQKPPPTVTVRGEFFFEATLQRIRNHRFCPPPDPLGRQTP